MRCIINSKTIPVDLLQFSMYIKFSAKKQSFPSLSFHYSSCLIVPQIPRIMLNNSADREHFYFFSFCDDNVPLSFTAKYNVGCQCKVSIFYYVKQLYILLTPNFQINSELKKPLTILLYFYFLFQIKDDRIL